MNSTENKYFISSALWLSIFTFIALLVFVFPVLGLVYTFVIRIIAVYFFIGAVVIIPFLAAVFGYLIGYVVYVSVLKNHQFNNPIVEFFIILMALIISYYFHWVFWVDSVVNTFPPDMSQISKLITEPNTLFNAVADINAIGTWEIDDDEDLLLGKTKGITLTVFWVFELLLITVYPFFVKEKIINNKNN